MAGNPLVGGIGFEIRAEDDKFIRDLKQAAEKGRRALEGVQDEADDVGRALDKAGAKGKAALQSVDRQADRAADSMARAQRQANLLRNTVSGLALGAAFVAGTRVLADFGQAMSTVQAITGATDQQFEALRAKAQALGATTRFSATEAADGMAFLARAGFNTDQVLGSIEGTLQLAQAGALGLGDAADIASNILQGFQIDVSETNRLVDIMAKAANSSNTNIRQLGDAMKYVGPVATGLGLSVEETTAGVSALSDAGLQATLAGTGLRKVLLSLEVPTTRGRKALERLKVNLDDVKVSQVGLAQALKNLKKAGLTNSDAKDIFGLIGLPAFQVLDSSIDKIERLTDAYKNAEGTAKKMAETMDDNLNGTLLATKSRIEALIIALGDAGSEQALVTALEGLIDLLQIAAQNADIVQAAIVALAVRALIPLAVATLGRAIPAIIGLGAQLDLIAFKAGRAAAATTLMGAAVSAVGGPVTLAIAAAAAAYVALARAAADVEGAVQKANSTMEKAREVARDLREDHQDLRKANEELEKAIEAGGDAAERTARREVAAIQQRIQANERLAARYAVTLKAQSAAAANELRKQQDELARSAVPLLAGSEGYLKLGPNAKAAEDELKKLEDYLIGLSDSGQKLSDQEIQFLVDVSELENARSTVEELQSSVDDLNRRAKVDRLAKGRKEAVLGDAQTPSIGQDISGEDFFGDFDTARSNRNITAVEEALDRIESLNEDLKAIEKDGVTSVEKAQLQRIKDQIAREEEFIKQLGDNKDASLARQIANGTANIDEEGDVPAGPLTDEAAQKRKRLAALKEELAINDALRAGDVARVDELKRQARERQLFNDLTENGMAAEQARAIAASTAAAEAKQAADERQKALDEYLASMGTETELQAAQAAGDRTLIDEIERRIEVRKLEQELLAKGYTADIDGLTARAKAEQVVDAKRAIAADKRRAEMADILGERDLDLRIQTAQLAGDEKLVKSLEKQRDLQERINELKLAGLDAEAATARAIAEQRTLADATPSELEIARREFKQALAGDIATSLSNAVRSGDYGNIVQEVIGSAAARGLETAITDLSEELAGFFTNIFLKGDVGVEGGFLSGLGNIFNPGTVDAATNEAVKGLGKASGEAATALSGQLAVGAATAAANNAVQSTSSVTASSSLLALATAATSAAAALTVMAAANNASGSSNLVSSALSSLHFGGNRALGGHVSDGTLYEVNERGIAELFKAGGRTFLLPGMDGQIEPLRSASLPARDGRDRPSVEVFAHGTGNEELDRLLNAAVQRAVRIANRTAGPASAEFRNRKL